MPTLSPNPGFHQSQPLDPLGAGLSEQGLAFGGMDTSHSLLCTPALPEALSACWDPLPMLLGPAGCQPSSTQPVTTSLHPSPPTHHLFLCTPYRTSQKALLAPPGSP